MGVVRAGLAVLASVVGVLAVAPATASAQACDPGIYGCPTTTTSGGPGVGTTIELDVDEGPPGTRVRARACGFVVGSTVTLTFGGTTVATGAAGADACVDLVFTVPGATPGRYPVCASAAGRPSACADFALTGVLAAGEDRARGAGEARGGALARTGITVAGLVLVAVALLLGGRALLRRTDRGEALAGR